jgi:hypothetical protein
LERILERLHAIVEVGVTLKIWEGRNDVDQAVVNQASCEVYTVKGVRRGLQAVPPEELDPGDDDRGAPDHRVERLEGLLLAKPRDPFDQEFKVGLNGTEIDVLRVTSRH